MISLIENQITTQEYLAIREKVGWKKLSNKQAQMAIDNSLYFIKAVDENGQLLGIGRIVGDGAVICYIQDLIVVPEQQGKRTGSLIIEKLIEFVEGIRQDDTEIMLCLMCAKGREEFYQKHGFIARPTDRLGPGMIRYMK